MKQTETLLTQETIDSLVTIYSDSKPPKADSVTVFRDYLTKYNYPDQGEALYEILEDFGVELVTNPLYWTIADLICFLGQGTLPSGKALPLGQYQLKN